MKKFLIAAAIFLQAVFLVPGRAAAQTPDNDRKDPKGDVAAVVTLGSHHFGRYTFTDNGLQRHFNEVNLGGGLEYRLNDRFHLGAGVYRNSIYKPAAYGLLGIETAGRRFLGAGVEIGVVSGYNIKP